MRLRSQQELVSVLCNRRYSEKTVAYAESHDQALVGDTTLGEVPPCVYLMIGYQMITTLIHVCLPCYQGVGHWVNMGERVLYFVQMQILDVGVDAHPQVRLSLYHVHNQSIATCN